MFVECFNITLYCKIYNIFLIYYNIHTRYVKNTVSCKMSENISPEQNFSQKKLY